MWRTVSRNVDVALLVVASCFGVGLFAVWAAHGFTWSSGDHPNVVAVKPPVVHVRPRLPRHPVRAPPEHRAAPTLTLVAARGPAWVSIRLPSGRTLYEGLIPRSRRLSFDGTRFLARFQAGRNLDALLHGRRTDLAPYELRRVMITKAGIRLLGTAPHLSGVPAVTAS